MLSLICIFTFLYSIFGVGGWAGMGLGAFTVSIYLGIIVGTILSVLVK
ncbi:YesK-like family protein [Virgibacillus dakarensis]|nr:YesK-like family protein [Virgibacillus dakarensis]